LHPGFEKETRKQIKPSRLTTSLGAGGFLNLSQRLQMVGGEPMTFKTFNAALTWGRTYGRDHVWPFQRWRIVKQGKEFALAIINVNTGEREGLINA
jgi:hypothetical protein